MVIPFELIYLAVHKHTYSEAENNLFIPIKHVTNYWNYRKNFTNAFLHNLYLSTASYFLFYTINSAFLFFFISTLNVLTICIK